MTMQRTSDILQRAREFHAQLSAFYTRLGKAAGREKVKMLLTYMSRHETNLVECLNQYERDAARRVLDTWFKYSSDQATCKCFEGIEIRPDAGVEEVIRIALKLDDCLMGLYKEMAERATNQEVRDLFNSLLRMEKRGETKMVRDALTLDQEL